MPAKTFQNPSSFLQTGTNVIIYFYKRNAFHPLLFDGRYCNRLIQGMKLWHGATSVFQTTIDVIDFGLSTKAAVNNPKFHHQWLPDEISVEPGFLPALLKSLERMGYTVNERGSIGRTEVIKVLPDDRFEGVADSRGEDSAGGY